MVQRAGVGIVAVLAVIAVLGTAELPVRSAEAAGLRRDCDGWCAARGRPSPTATLSALAKRSPAGLGRFGQRLGTELQWAANPAEAAAVAQRDSKLVFLLQLSGDFARPEFT